MTNYLSRLIREEDGAVTVDWVVLTSLVVSMAFVVVHIVLTAAVDPADGLGAHLSTMDTSVANK
jgi:Flp pilus assembly pilin Flp